MKSKSTVFFKFLHSPLITPSFLLFSNTGVLCQRLRYGLTCAFKIETSGNYDLVYDFV